MTFKTEYRISAWKWNGEEYEKVILRDYELYEEAQRDFDKMIVSSDMPQIDLYRVDYMRTVGAFCEIGLTLYDRKE